jgi:hypothetical protein
MRETVHGQEHWGSNKETERKIEAGGAKQGSELTSRIRDSDGATGHIFNQKAIRWLQQQYHKNGKHKEAEGASRPKHYDIRR